MVIKIASELPAFFVVVDFSIVPTTLAKDRVKVVIIYNRVIALFF
jgi:hypothetical protein